MAGAPLAVGLYVAVLYTMRMPSRNWALGEGHERRALQADGKGRYKVGSSGALSCGRGLPGRGLREILGGLLLALSGYTFTAGMSPWLLPPRLGSCRDSMAACG